VDEWNDDDADELDDLDEDSGGNIALSLSELALVDLLGATSIVSLRGSAVLGKWLALAADMKTATIKRLMRANHGRKLLRNVLEQAWPIPIHRGYAPALATVRVAAVKRAPTMVESVARLLGIHYSSVFKTLSSVAGNMLVGNVFPSLMELEAETDEKSVDDDYADRPKGGQAATRLRTRFVASQNTVTVGVVLVDRWRVVRLLGRGGFGDVFEICSPSGTRRVAKFARLGSAPVKSIADSILLNELRHLQDLEHAHVCRVFGMRSDPTYGDFLQLEHGGTSLLDHANNRVLTHREAARIVRDIASALDYLHGEDVIHGDVTPSNILIDDSMHVRLTDFGTSARLKASASPAHTRLATQGPALSPNYAPPEAYNSPKITKHGDQYSLAMVYVALVTGLHFRPQVELALKRTPRSVEDALARALHVFPQRRFENCASFARALST
ncbi:MAG: serine/threonine protein kinase, partial [Verrucomicrobiaceae bacterium]